MCIRHRRSGVTLPPPPVPLDPPLLPTPAATLRMFIWLPLGILVAILRLFIGSVFPCNLIIPLFVATGMDLRVSGPTQPTNGNNKGKGILYVCNHRILFDPTFLTGALRKPLTAVTYGLSRTTEIISPIKTVRLTRDRKRDRDTMQRLLAEGDLVVCPEGTTCREPYLLRFSSLFAELADEIVPVAIDTEVSMFYGRTTTGRKWLDPILFLANPRPVYSIRILDMIPEQLTCAGGKTSHEVANYIQRELGEALGFECTNLTRRDKHLMIGKNKN